MTTRSVPIRSRPKRPGWPRSPRLERLCRHVASLAVAGERLSRLDDGRLLYRLKRRWRDSTAATVFEPEEFVTKPAALVPLAMEVTNVRHIDEIHGARDRDVSFATIESGHP